MLNRIVLIGRLTADPELRHTQTGKPVAKFTLAVDRTFKDANGKLQVDFINVVVWGKIGELSAQYLAKGKVAAVDGRLEIQSYDAKDGTKRQAAQVVADQVRFLTPRTEGNAPSDAGYLSGDVDAMNPDDLPF